MMLQKMNPDHSELSIQERCGDNYIIIVISLVNWCIIIIIIQKQLLKQGKNVAVLKMLAIIISLWFCFPAVL